MQKVFLLLFLLSPFFVHSQENNQLTPEKYFLSFYEDAPFEKIYIYTYDHESGDHEKISLEKGRYFLGNEKSTIKFKFSVNDTQLITGVYRDFDYEYEEYEYYEDEINRENKYQEIKIVDSKVISSTIKSVSFKFVTIYDHTDKTAVAKKYDSEGEVTDIYYYYDDDHSEGFLSLEKHLKYNDDRTYIVRNISDNTINNYSNNDQLLTIEHVDDNYLDIYNEKGNIVRKEYLEGTYFIGNSIKEPKSYTYSILKKRKNNSYEYDEVQLIPNITYNIVTKLKGPIDTTFKTDEQGLINGPISFYENDDNEELIIHSKNSFPIKLTYKNISKKVFGTGYYEAIDSSFTTDVSYELDSIYRRKNKEYYIAGKDDKKISTKYYKKGGYTIENPFDNTFKKYNDNDILLLSKSLDDSTKDKQEYNDKGQLLTSIYTKNNTLYNETYNNGELSKRDYTNSDGDITEYYINGKLYRKNITYFNDDGILYLKVYNQKNKLKKNVEMPVVDGKPAPELIKL